MVRYLEIFIYANACHFVLHLYRNVDSNIISGVLNVTRLLDIIQATTTLYMSQPLGVVSLMNNNITDAVYQPDDVLNNGTVVK